MITLEEPICSQNVIIAGGNFSWKASKKAYLGQLYQDLRDFEWKCLPTIDKARSHHPAFYMKGSSLLDGVTKRKMKNC